MTRMSWDSNPAGKWLGHSGIGLALRMCKMITTRFMQEVLDTRQKLNKKSTKSALIRSSRLRCSTWPIRSIWTMTVMTKILASNSKLVKMLRSIKTWTTVTMSTIPTTFRETLSRSRMKNKFFSCNKLTQATRDYFQKSFTLAKSKRSKTFPTIKSSWLRSYRLTTSRIFKDKMISKLVVLLISEAILVTISRMP